MSNVNSKITALANEIRMLSDTTDLMGLDTMTNILNSENTEFNSNLLTQESLLSQIKSALNGKTAEGSSKDADTLLNLINGSLVSFEDSRITTIAQYAFTYHPTLQSISLPNVTRTNTRAFDHASVLKSLSLPGLTGTTYTYLCSYCTALTDVDIKNAKTISNYTFYYCTALTKLDLHKATSIGTNVFNASSKFTTLIIRTDSVCTLSGTNSFTGTKIASGTGYIYVPSALIDNYKTATNWSTYANQFRAIEDYPEICG